VGRMAIVVRHSKRGRSRMVPLDAQTERRIDEWLASELGRELLKLGDMAPLFAGVRRRAGNLTALKPGQVANIVKSYAVAVPNVDPDKITPHALRHTFCTAVALHPKGGIKRVQALAGHADLRTSARYVDVDIDDAAAAVGAVWS
jgi:site-specific recombinase XerD